MAAKAFEVEGLAEFRAQLRDADRAFPRELTKFHRSIARDVLLLARANAARLSPMQRKAASALGARATQTGAAIVLNPSTRVPFVDAAFWGALRRTGWNRWDPYSRPQFPAWVGATWTVGVAGEGPYAINDAIATYLPRIDGLYDDMFDRVGAIAGFR